MENPYQIIPAAEIQKGDMIVNIGVVEEIEDFTQVRRFKISKGTKVSHHHYPFEAIGKDQQLTIIR